VYGREPPERNRCRSSRIAGAIRTTRVEVVGTISTFDPMLAKAVDGPTADGAAPACTDALDASIGGANGVVMPQPHRFAGNPVRPGAKGSVANGIAAKRTDCARSWPTNRENDDRHASSAWAR